MILFISLKNFYYDIYIMSTYREKYIQYKKNI